MTVESLPVSIADARQLEDYALNASGAFQSLVYDGWLVGYRPGSSKRLRCVNPLYPSTLPIPEKIEYCAAFHRGVGLPPLFRLLPFSLPVDLDHVLDRAGWTSFERTLVQHMALDSIRIPALPAVHVEMLPVPVWTEATAELLELAAKHVPGAVERAREYPLPQAAAVVRHDGRIVACGLLRIERDTAGLFALATSPPLRGSGMGRAIVAALLQEAGRLRARRAYLQVSASNVAALALYERFGFTTAYHYWYRGLDL